MPEPHIDHAFALGEVQQIKVDITREWRRLRKAIRGLRAERETLLEYVSRSEIKSALGPGALDEIADYARRVRARIDRISARPEPEPEPEPQPQPVWPIAMKAVRPLARWELRDGVEAYESADGRHAEASAASARLPDGPERDRVLLFRDLAFDARENARRAIALAILLMWRDDVDRLEDLESGRIEWEPRGATLEERFVWIEPATGDDGKPDFDVTAAKVSLIDLTAVEDLGSSLTGYKDRHGEA